MGFGFGNYDAFDYSKIEQEMFMAELEYLLTYGKYKGENPFIDYMDEAKKIKAIVDKVLLTLNPYDSSADELKDAIEEVLSNNTVATTGEKLDELYEEKVSNPEELYKNSREAVKGISELESLKGLSALVSLFGGSLEKSFARSFSRTELIADTEAILMGLDYKNLSDNHNYLEEALNDLDGYNPNLDNEEFNEEYIRAVSRAKHIFNKMGHCKKVIEQDVIRSFASLAEEYQMGKVKEHLSEKHGIDFDEPEIKR